jgi:hypothetical protein
MFQRVSTGFAVGAVLGTLIVVGLVATETRVHEPRSGHAAAGVPSEEAAREFVEDWRRMREGTWTIDSTYVRVAEDGRTSRSEIHEAQRPPDRIRTISGTTSIERPGKLIVCAPDTGDAKGSCRTQETSETYEQGVAEEVGGVEQLVTGPASTYGVSKTSRHCYALQAVTTGGISNWGERAAFCFDDETGALKSTEVVRGGVTDSITATSISGDVKDSEFDKAAV